MTLPPIDYLSIRTLRSYVGSHDVMWKHNGGEHLAAASVRRCF
ncbi:hypothetical protein [Aeoliella straminimaris]|nr:hypothetical protein [Aeoliella straminimaris]